MPGTFEEHLEYARAFTRGAPMAWDHVWADASGITEEERKEIFALIAYMMRAGSQQRSAAQRRALITLRTFMTPPQRDALARTRYFYAQVPSGATYRLSPHNGTVERVERHGRRWYAIASYCLHDDDSGDGHMPHADLSLAHLLLLSADEPAFLSAANVTTRILDCWNGDYLRRMRRGRKAHRR